MNLPRTLDNEKLDNPTQGPFSQSLKQTAGRQDDDLVVFGLKPFINKVVSLMTFPFHWVSACKLVSLQAGIHIIFVMDLNRLLKTHCIPWWVELFCQLTRCQDSDMQPCKYKDFIYRFHDNVYNLYSLWLNSKLIIMVFLFNKGFYFKKLWNIFKNTLLNSKLLAVHQWENCSLIQNVVHFAKESNEGAFMGGYSLSHWRQEARVG